MTFTNKAAGEMRTRITALTGSAQAKELTCGTFHSFCARSLRADAERVGLVANFAICDAADQLSTMKNALREIRVAESTIHPKACLAMVSLLKNKLVSPSASWTRRSTTARSSSAGPTPATSRPCGGAAWSTSTTSCSTW